MSFGDPQKEGVMRSLWKGQSGLSMGGDWQETQNHFTLLVLPFVHTGT